MDLTPKDEFEDDVEADCAMIEPIGPVHDIDDELPTKDLRFNSTESGYFGSLDSGFDSKLSEDLKKLDLASIEEGSQEGDLYDEVKKTDTTDTENQYEILDHNELLMEIFKPDKDGDSQLHMAIIQMLAPISMYFINLIPSHHWLNLPNNLLQVPLHLATITRQAQIVWKLMSAGADIVARDYKGDTALHIACREGFDDIVEILLTPVKYNETSEIKYPLENQNVPQDTRLLNYNGQSCLHLAAERTHLPILRLLLKAGADINIKDGKCGKTVLHYAAEVGNHVLLEFLLSQENLDLDANTYGGMSAVQLAYGRGLSDVVQTLRRRGAEFVPLPVTEGDSDEDMNE